MLVPVQENISETQVKFPEFLQPDTYTDEKWGGGEKALHPLSSLHPAVSSSLLFPPSPIPRLPPGIECSQSARWAECIIHRLFWGVCMHSRVRTKSWGSRLWSHYRSNGGVLDAVPCQSHLKCKSQMSVKRFITHDPPRFMWGNRSIVQSQLSSPRVRRTYIYTHSQRSLMTEFGSFVLHSRESPRLCRLTLFT